MIPGTELLTHDMLLQWTVCPQGSKNGATVFARVVQSMFQGAPDTISVYQDDIFNHAKNIAEHLKGMEFILDRLRKKGLVAKLKNASSTTLKYRL